MNCNTGEIFKVEDLPEEQQKILGNMAAERMSKLEQLSKIQMEEAKPYVPIEPKDLPRARRLSPARRKAWMRNRPCPCKSGKKFKRCCWNMFTE